MKQTQPSDNGSGPLSSASQVRNGEWWLQHAKSPGACGESTSETLWEAPAVTGVWVRMALDVTYSQHSNEGKVKLYLDRNGDGDSLDAEEQSPTITTHTLKYETPDPDGSPRHRWPGARGLDPLPPAGRPLPRSLHRLPGAERLLGSDGQRAGRWAVSHTAAQTPGARFRRSSSRRSTSTPGHRARDRLRPEDLDVRVVPADRGQSCVVVRADREHGVGVAAIERRRGDPFR